MPFTTFFADTAPDRWGVLSYLNACYQQSLQKKTKFDFSSAIDSYLESLRAIIKNKSESAKVNRAQTLFNRYYEKGRSSDRACAHEWKRKRRDADSRAGKAKATLPKKHSQQKRRTGPPTIIYNNHGVTVNGSVYHSSLAPAPQPNDFPNDPSPSDPGTPDNRQSEDIEKEGDEDLWEKEDDTVVSDDLRESIHEDAEEEALPPSIEFLANLERISREFKHKSKLSDGKYLEDILIAYAKTLKHIDVAHWLIIDPTDKNLETLLSSNGWDGIAEGQSFMLPRLPEALSEHISKYAGITDRTACRAVASSTDKEWESRVCDTDHLFLKRWIDGASDHVISLITESNDLLNVKKPLQEGAWEGLYYPILDKCFTNLGELMLQRDIALLAHENDANPVLNYSIRHDGVLHTRDVLLRPGRRLEFAIVEISKKFDGYKSTKWNGDLTKLYAGCIAILRDLKKAVNYHPPTVAKLAAAGVLQAGPMTMVLILSCIGPNLYYLRRGDPRVLPCEVQQFSTLGDVLTVVWKVRETARLSYQAVKDYLNKIEGSTRILDRTDARFL